MDWLNWAKRMQAIAQTGLTYTENPYDYDRYQQLRALAAEIVAAHTGQAQGELEATFACEAGYATPKVEVRAVVFQDGKLLLVRERSDGGWAPPGGWADVGDSPADMAVREVREESGYAVRPTKLLAVWERARHGLPPLFWSVYTVYIRCELVGGSPTGSMETYGAAFFGRDELPPLSVGRVSPSQIARLFDHLDDPNLPADFD